MEMIKFKPFLTVEEMSKLSTKRLLSYFRKRLNYGRSCENSWCAYDGCETKCEHGAYRLAFLKAREETKAILSGREHVEQEGKHHEEAARIQRRPFGR